MSRRFPHAPRLDEANPFRDDRGHNPFADGAPPSTSQPDPLAAPAAREIQPYRPADFETTLPGRGRFVWKLGFAGLLAAGLALMTAAVGLVREATWAGGLAYGLPLALIALALSVATWIFSSADLRAIRAQAMGAGSLPATRAAHRLGILSLGLAAGLLLGFVTALLLQILR